MNRICFDNDQSLPVLGLGTHGISKADMNGAIQSAANAKYSLFDTSPNYHNDYFLAKALKQSFTKRSDYQIITKINSDEQWYNIRKVAEKSLKRMRIDYIDLYLIHWPFPELYLNTWKQLERLYEDGIAKMIGVCNFMPHHLKPLLNVANIKPCVNQIELHPFFTQNDAVAFCQKEGIEIMSYTPLARMNRLLIENPMLVSLGHKYGKTVPQIILRWNVQRGFCVIPKSASATRIAQNSDIFDFALSENEILKISSLNMNKRYRYDPDELSRYHPKKSLASKTTSDLRDFLRRYKVSLPRKKQ